MRARGFLRTLTLLLALPLGAARASAQAASSAPLLPADRPPEWSFAEGYGFIVHFDGGHSHEKAFYAHPGVSFRLSSRVEYLAEAHVAHFVSPGGYVLGALPIGGRLYFGDGPVLPYASLGMGIGWTNLEKLDEIDQRFNFLLQGSLGVRIPTASSDSAAPWAVRAWTVEARVAHLSNAGASEPNLGLNMVVLLGGIRFR